MEILTNLMQSVYNYGFQLFGDKTDYVFMGIIIAVAFYGIVKCIELLAQAIVESIQEYIEIRKLNKKAKKLEIEMNRAK